MKLRRKHDIQTGIDFLVVAALLVFAIVYAYNQFITSPPYVNPERYPVRGIDISAHNGMMNLRAAAESGIDFVFIKASEGTDFRDANFRMNYDKAMAAGMKVGAYHFFRFDKDGMEQAKNYLAAVGNRHLHLGLAVDVEQHGNPEGIAPDLVIQRLTDMVDYLNLKGHRVILYTNRNGYYDWLASSFPGYPLWICSFNETPINAEWTFWQYDHHGSVPGIRGDVDLNAFAGNLEEWENYVATGQMQ